MAAWIVGGALVGAGALAVVEGGLFDATATTPHGPLVPWATHIAFLTSARRRASDAAPAHYDAAEVTDGLALYQSQCVMCHGGPGVARTDWVSGMNPTPREGSPLPSSAGSSGAAPICGPADRSRPTTR